MKDKKMDNINLQSSLDLESFEGVRNLNESFDGIEEISAKKSFDRAEQNDNSSQPKTEEKPKYQIAPDHN
ncbi:hypothetical protein [Aliarcobacter cryaerophilus]|uniref:hypothetical protein n=1 Tax=Aliarcobacter cryaerophilus TaxID=28198 RepID=UPI003DA66212